MQRTHRYATFTILLILMGISGYNHAFAAKKSRTRRIFPHGCRQRGYAFEGGLLVLTPTNENAEIQAQTLYMVNNKSHSNVTLIIQKLPHQTFSPSYKNLIYRYEWGAFALNQKKLQFVCTLASANTNEERVDCSQVLQICEYNNVKFADSNEGTYWIAKSNSQRTAMQKAIDSGILLRW